MDVIRFADVVNRNDVWMIQSGSGLCFANKPAHAVGICGNLSGQNLEGDFSIKLGVLSEKHLTHPAFADGREDLILIKN